MDHHAATREFLVEAAILLHRYGTPSHRLEPVMAKVSRTLGVDGTFLYTPTALVISLRDPSGESTYMRRVESGTVDVDKLIRFDDVLERLEDGKIDLQTARQAMFAVAQSPPPYSIGMTILACAGLCCAVAIFLGGSLVEASLALEIGLAIAGLEWLHGKRGWPRGVLEPFAGFFAAIASLAFARWVLPLDDRLVTLASLVILLPGLNLTIALTELAVGHLTAGVARLAGASVTLLTLTAGVALAWRLGSSWRTVPESPLWPLPAWASIIGLALAPIGFAILFRARFPQWPIIALVSISGFAISRFGAQWGPEAGAFLGSLIVGCGANLYARLRDRPALVPLTPGLILLVPGSFGYRSLTSMLDQQTILGIEQAFTMIMLAISLVAGVLTANAILPPKRIL